MIDFTDPRNPEEVAFGDLDGTNTWSAYTYPRRSGVRNTLPVYSNDGLSRDYDPGPGFDYREKAYGFMRFEADVRSNLVGFDRLNPQLQEQVIKMYNSDRQAWLSGTAAKHTQGKASASGENRSARHWSK